MRHGKSAAENQQIKLSVLNTTHKKRKEETVWLRKQSQRPMWLQGPSRRAGRNSAEIAETR
jgi:hypothetical protein